MRLITLMLLTNLVSTAYARSSMLQNVSADSLVQYNRLLSYDVENLSTEQKVEREVNVMAAKIQAAVTSAYDAELKQTQGDSNLAKLRVMQFATKDLKLADSKIAEEIINLTQQTLDDLETGGTSNSVALENVTVKMKSNVAQKMILIDNEKDENPVCCEKSKTQPTVNASKDADKKIYASNAEVIESLVSTRDSARWVSTSNQNITLGHAKKNDGKIGVSVTIPFLGISGDLGSTVIFKRETSTSATIIAEGLHPVLLANGNFDYFRRDQNHQIIVTAGKQTKRFVSFTCDAQMNFSNEKVVGGGLSFSVPGVSVSGERNWTTSYSNQVTLTSRRISLPEYIGGQSVTVKMLADLCHNYFLKAKFNNNMSVEKSLDMMMRNIISNLEISNSKTKCAVEEQCYDWYNKRVAGLFKMNNWPRCEQEAEGYLNCKLKGLKGQNCAVIEKKTRLSDGQFEFGCDEGLKCVKTQNIIYATGSLEKFLYGNVKQFAKGRCMPTSKAYKDPMTLQNEREATAEKRIEINFQ